MVCSVCGAFCVVICGCNGTVCGCCCCNGVVCDVVSVGIIDEYICGFVCCTSDLVVGIVPEVVIGIEG